MKRTLLAVVVALSGCVSPQLDSEPIPLRIIPYSGGLKIADSGGQEISFSRKQPGVEQAINRLTGAEPTERRPLGQCEALRWENGLVLFFVNGDFVGWIAGPPVWPAPERTAGNTCGWSD